MNNFVLLLLIIIVPKIAKAFPQMIRHGYTSCTTCHVNPRGGEVMTDYGRALSGAVLSKWAYEGEEQWHYGALKSTPDWLKVGGDFRSVQVHKENSAGKFGRYIEMQEQVQVVAKLNSENTFLSVTGASYTREPSKPWYLPGYFLSTQIGSSLNLKVGRFTPRFGINVPEHIFSTRGAIGFGPHTERETLELFYLQDRWDLSFSVTGGELKNEEEAEAFYAQANYSFTKRDRVGVSLEKKTANDKAFSVAFHGLIGFSEHLYLITDTVYREFEGFTGNQEGVYHFSKLGYEFTKGFHLFVMEDIKKSDFSKNNNTDSFYGVGLTAFPRPHLEVQFVLRKLNSLSTGLGKEDEAFVMLHYYL